MEYLFVYAGKSRWLKLTGAGETEMETVRKYGTVFINPAEVLIME